MPANAALAGSGDTLKLGVRPEYVALVAAGDARRAAGDRDAGAGHRHLLAAQRAHRQRRERIADPRPRSSPEQTIPKAGDAVWLGVVGTHTCFYRDEELVTGVNP